MLATKKYVKSHFFQHLDPIDCSDNNTQSFIYDLSVRKSLDEWKDISISLIKEKEDSSNCVIVPSYTIDAFEFIRYHFDWYAHYESVGFFINFDEFGSTKSPGLRYNCEGVNCTIKCDNNNYTYNSIYCNNCHLYDRCIEYGKRLSSFYFKSEYKEEKKQQLDILRESISSIPDDVLQYTIGELLKGKITDIDSFISQEQEQEQEQNQEEKETNVERQKYSSLPNSEFVWLITFVFEDGTYQEYPILPYMKRSETNYGIFIDITDPIFSRNVSYFYLQFGCKEYPVTFYQSEEIYIDHTIVARQAEILESITNVDWPQDD